MADKNTIFTTGIQTVVAFFGAFGAFLLDILPEPISGRPLIYGFAQMACLLIFLGIKATLFRNDGSKRRWKLFAALMAGVFLVCSVAYYWQDREHYTNVGKSTTMVITGDFKPEQLAKCNDSLVMSRNTNHLPCKAYLLSRKNLGNYQALFVDGSIDYHSGKFVVLYLLAVLALFTGVFALVEVLTAKTQ